MTIAIGRRFERGVDAFSVILINHGVSQQSLGEVVYDDRESMRSMTAFSFCAKVRAIE